MSTRSTIIYNQPEGVHIYEEMADGNVYLEIGRDGLNLELRLMSMEDWERHLIKFENGSRVLVYPQREVAKDGG